MKAQRGNLSNFPRRDREIPPSNSTNFLKMRENERYSKEIYDFERLFNPKV
jgi:hypothetical protein